MVMADVFDFLINWGNTAPFPTKEILEIRVQSKICFNVMTAEIVCPKYLPDSIF